MGDYEIVAKTLKYQMLRSLAAFAVFMQNECNISKVSTECNCDLQVLSLNGVKHVNNNTCEIHVGFTRITFALFVQFFSRLF